MKATKSAGRVPPASGGRGRFCFTGDGATPIGLVLATALAIAIVLIVLWIVRPI